MSSFRPVTIPALALLFTGCAESFDPAAHGLPGLDGYAAWPSVAFHGTVPGHKRSYRIVFVDPNAMTYTGSGAYPVGTMFVKEIHELGGSDAEPAPAGLRYLAIMRKVAPGTEGVGAEGGWVFTLADDAGSGERRSDSCWSCHRDAPFDGAFFDYAAAVE